MQGTAFPIIRALFPALVSSARYARLIQRRIESVEDKEDATNIFAAALSDADLTIQTAIEVEMLARFPDVPFFGEEWKSSRNTKYLIGTHFVEGCDHLVTLDPIDGTRHYLDGHALYQIILTVVSRDAFEGVIVLFPEFGDYVFALEGQGAFRGTLDAPLEDARAWVARPPARRRVFLDDPYLSAYDHVSRNVDEVYRLRDYTAERPLYHLAAALRNELSGAILHRAQIIDGAALAFVAREMGYTVRELDSASSYRPIDSNALVVPGYLVAESPELAALLAAGLSARS